MIYSIKVDDLRKNIPILRVGDRVNLSGVVYTSRDAAHKRITESLDKGIPLPYPIKDSVIYYVGPTPTPLDLPIGSCGPTTSSRMDNFAPRLLDSGLSAMIGKGPRNKNVCDAIVRNHAVYFCAIGGAGALLAKSVEQCEVVAYEDLGCESVKKLTIKDLPLIVAIDSEGNNIFKK